MRSWTLSVALFFTFTSLAFAQNTVSVPEGTHLHVKLLNTIAADMKVGAEVKMELTEDAKGPDGSVVVPKKAKIFGTITRAVPSNTPGIPSQLSFMADRAEWKDHTASLAAFMVGGLDVQVTAVDTAAKGMNAQQPSTSDLGGGNNIYATAHYGTATEATQVHDRSAVLRAADDPRVASEVYVNGRTVRMEQGSTVMLRNNPSQLNPK